MGAASFDGVSALALAALALMGLGRKGRAR
jgi:hypothetical protein